MADQRNGGIRTRSQLHVVAVTGGRHYGVLLKAKAPGQAGTEYLNVHRTLDRIHAERRIDVLVTGGATGADAIAEDWARRNRVQLSRWAVTREQWHEDRSWGPRRNEMMLAVTMPDLLVAFPGGTGTNGCVRAAAALGVAVADERNPAT